MNTYAAATPGLMPEVIDQTATYVHAESGHEGLVEDWAEDPDGSLKVRINDHWLFFAELTKKEPDAETA